MKKQLTVRGILSAVFLLVFLSGSVWAKDTPDHYLGDAAIYGVNGVKPNVLIAIDNSAMMTQAGGTKPYDPNKTYTGSYITNEIYVRVSATGGVINYNDYGLSLSGVSCSAASSSLSSTGAYYGKLKKDGTCNAAQAGNYYTGNLLNFINTPVPTWHANTAYAAGDVVTPTAGGKSYVCTTSGTSGPTEPVWPTTSGVTVTDNTTAWEIVPSDILKMVQDTMAQVAVAVRDSVNIGLMVFGQGNKGGQIVTEIKDISDLTSDGPTNFTNLTNAVNNITLLGGNQQPVNEVIWDGGVYYRGQYNTALLINSAKRSLASPMKYSCQKNYIIILTSGNSDDNVNTKGLLTDLNSNSNQGDVADAAKFNYDQDNDVPVTTDNKKLPAAPVSADPEQGKWPGAQRIQTTVIQLLTPENTLLHQAANLGHGDYFSVWNTTQLTQALYDSMANVMTAVDTSFVAPVVPVSPDNKVYTGYRVYMGFFKPQADHFWIGNIKKFALSTDGNQNILDKNLVAADPGVPQTNYATYVDANGDGKDDRDGASLGGNPNGGFRPSSQSFWNSSQDAGTVESGGAGEVLQNRKFSVSCAACDMDLGSDVRKIYTYTGTSKDLTDPSNAFTTTNSAITASLLGLPGNIITSGTPTDVKMLINFIHGIDVYDIQANGRNQLTNDYTNKKLWIFGDVLHSKPYVITYNRYNFKFDTAADFQEALDNEKTVGVNKTMIYVGSNDGMLHAINDLDGTEAWAFIPPDLLKYLEYTSASTHNYFVDLSVYGWVNDQDNDGVIQPPNDTAILLIGLRRGAGLFGTHPTTGYYYALDVTDRLKPKLLWSITNTGSFSDMGEAWSEPKIIKIKYNGQEKIVAVFGGGYDNCYEDGRYGATQSYSTTCVSTSTTNDGGLDLSNLPKTSTGTASPGSLADYKGRGVYMVELATLNGASPPTVPTSPTLLWSYTYSQGRSPSVGYGIISEVTAVDSTLSGYADKLYAGDAAGNLWRFDIGDSNSNNWKGYIIFNSNPGADGSTGRKIFYRPAVTIDDKHNVWLFFGTGDREHPLNRAVIDRMYAFIDRNGGTTSSAKTESEMVDVTVDNIQLATSKTGASGYYAILQQLWSETNYGWYIRLDAGDYTSPVAYPGEKVLAYPVVFKGIVAYTTYAPSYETNPDPCAAGNPGTARAYIVDYTNGNAVLDFDTSNDTSSNYTTYKNNIYAIGGLSGTSTDSKSIIYQRTDRHLTLGSGIPSSPVINGNQLLVGTGGSLVNVQTGPRINVRHVYWRLK